MVTLKQGRGTKFGKGSNVERPIFRNFKITNIKIAKDTNYSIILFTNLFFIIF